VHQLVADAPAYGVRGGWRATFDLPDASQPYAAVIDHTLGCLRGDADNLIEPAGALPTLELTLDVYQCLTQAAR
jgi:hypothetical protein